MENNFDTQYLNLLKDILQNGEKKDTRSGEVLSVFGRTIRIDLQKGFPLLTTKRVFYRGVIEELLWFLRGESNINYLVDKDVHIWDKDAYRYYKKLKDESSSSEYPTHTDTFEEFIHNVKKNKSIFFDDSTFYKYGSLGRMYPSLWRSYGRRHIDQIKNIIKELKNNPTSRRIILTCYEPETADHAALYPCHILYEFNVSKNKQGRNTLNCVLNCRSTDCPLGLPFNIASAAFLIHMLAQVTDMEVGELLYVGCDCHIYTNQIDSVTEQLQRDPCKFKLPVLELNKHIMDIDDFKYEDFKILNYKSYPSIKAPLSVGDNIK